MVIVDFIFIAILSAVFFFYLFRPQSDKNRDDMLKKITPGDWVRIESGIIGSVIEKKDGLLLIKSFDTSIVVTMESVQEILKEPPKLRKK